MNTFFVDDHIGEGSSPLNIHSICCPLTSVWSYPDTYSTYLHTGYLIDNDKHICFYDEYVCSVMHHVESMYTNIDHTEGLQAVMEIIGNYPIYDPGIERLEVSLKSNASLFNDEWFIQKVASSMGSDWAPRHADICMVKSEKEASLKCQLKSPTYYRYLDDVFI